MANVLTGFMSGYPVSGSFTRTALNYNAGGRTPLANVFSGLWVLIAVLALALCVGCGGEEAPPTVEDPQPNPHGLRTLVS